MITNFLPNAAASYDSIHKTQQSETAALMGFTPDIECELNGRMHRVCHLNLLGYIPIVSTVSGLYRTLVGLSYSVKCVAGTVFDRKNRAQHKEGLKIGSVNVGRGLLEMVPFLGNIVMEEIDQNRLKRHGCGNLHEFVELKRACSFEIYD